MRLTPASTTIIPDDITAASDDHPMRLPLDLLALAALCLSLTGLPLAAADDATPTTNASTATGLAAITVPEGFEVTLAAGQPLIERPMLAAFDDQGRLYVCDSAGVNLRGPELAKNPPHTIRILEDTDGDGAFDRSSVFADKMLFPQGILWHDGAIYCSSPPSFWKLTDTDGDGRCDHREELVTGFANTGVADDMHGGSLGPDGRLYWCAGRFPHEIRRPGGPVIHKGTAPLILRCKPDGSELEVLSGSQGNAVGVAFTREGDTFSSGTYLAPNWMGAELRDALVHCIDGAEYPVRDRILNEHKRTGELFPPLTHLGFAASSDLTICRGDALGEASRGQLFSALFNMHKIMRHNIAASGATFTCHNEDFLVSADADFHPTDVLQDADGSLLVIDTGGWFRIGCPTSQVAKPEVLGAIYRVRHKDAKPARDPRGLAVNVEVLAPEALCDLLSDARFAVVDRAQAELAKRGAEAVPALAQLLKNSSDVDARCAAVWTLCRIDDASAREPIRKALADQHASVRQAAARAAGLHRDAQARLVLEQLAQSGEAPVRREAATALGRIGKPASVPALLTALASPVDRFLEHATIFALITINSPDLTATGLSAESPATKRGAMIALDQTAGPQLTSDRVLSLLDPKEPALREAALWVISHHPEWAEATLPYFRQQLARGDLPDSERTALRQQLLAFAANESIQDLIATALAASSTPRDTRLLLLESIAEAAPRRLSPAWVAALQAALADSDALVASQAIATIRSLPQGGRPTLVRIDPQVNYPETKGNFADGNLSGEFSVRWRGILHCPTAGTYEFSTNSDDGSQLFIDGQLVVDNGGSHGMRERSGRIELTAGDHQLVLDFIEEGGGAGCILSWTPPGGKREVIPASALAHPSSSESTGHTPGLIAEFYPGAANTLPDVAISAFDPALVAIVNDADRPAQQRVQAAATVAARLDHVEPAMFAFLTESLHAEHPPLERLDAAKALGKSSLSKEQLTTLGDLVSTAGVLELPRLILAFEKSHDAAIGQKMIAALKESPGLRSVRPELLSAVLNSYPDDVKAAARPLYEALTVDTAKQQAKLAALTGVLTGGEIQRGRDLFFGNKKAICATCHAVQGQGGRIGPDLSKIGAIRTGRDLLEAIVVPSASFARGYEAFIAATASGETYTGVITRETPDAVYLFSTDRVETRISRDELEALSQSSVSIMPEGMEAQLSQQELADLIAFLQSLK